MKVIITIAMLLSIVALRAQVDFRLIEQHIIDDYKILKKASLNGNPERQQIFAKKVERQIMFALLQEGSYYYPFIRLQEHIQIVESSDKKVRVFSWDGRRGNSWRKMHAIAQFRGVRNEPYFRVLSSGEQRVENYEDVCINAIHQLNDRESGQVYYLMIGWGSHGVEQEHATIRLCYLAHNTLMDCETCLGGKNTLTLKGSSNFPVNLSYDSRRKQFRYLMPTYDPITGKRKQGLYHKMYWANGQFRRN